jgi:phosphoribosylaminoimidazole-succinocarboxamide synthase
MDLLAGRSMLVEKLQAFPVECVVRGYLEGSGWKEYREKGEVCGVKLPPGLVQGSRLPEPIFTPTTKAHTGHDEPITRSDVERLIGREHADHVIGLSLEVYRTAAEYALARGIIIADTKFEFGVKDGRVVMIDECLTPDSSRFWDAEGHRPGGSQPSFDKQFVRDYLDQSGWDREPPAPSLPEDVAQKTAEKYREIFTRLTGRHLQ